MDNNSKAATPVNLEGVGPGFPGLPVDATIVAPLPLPVEIASPLPVPVTTSEAFPVKREQFGGDPKINSVISGIDCELRTLTGYNSDPTAANQLYVQLHELDAIPIPAGHVPKVVIPVKGGKTPFSLSQELTFSPGLVIGISTTEWTYTASATPYLCWQCTYGTAT